MATKPQTPLYDGMFIFNQATEGGSLSGAVEQLRELLRRADAEVIALYKWDERRLAYEIKKQRRALYLQVYFRCEGSKIVGIERDVTLSETVLRCLIVRADHIGEVELDLAKQKEAETNDAMRISQVKAEADVDAEASDDAGVDAEVGAVDDDVATAEAEVGDDTPSDNSDDSVENENV